MTRVVAAAIAATLAAALPALSLPAHALDHVRISYVVPTVNYGALFIAIDQGYFAQEGIAPELVQAGGGVATPGLISGDLQFSGSPSVALSADMKGAHLKAVFVGSDQSAFQLWVQPDIKTLDDLKGKQIGIISRGDTTEIGMRYVLAKRNLPDDFLSYTPMGPGIARVAAIESGSFPGALIDAGQAADMARSGKLGKLHMLIDLNKEVHMVFGGFATSDALIKSNPDLVRRTVRALMKGLAVVRSARAETVAALVKHGSTETAAGEDYDQFASTMSPTAVTSDADQALELKVRAKMLGVDPATLPPPSRFFDFSFVKQAAAELKKENWKP
ncbi:MAG TPA: ABC transporter substrate-binding protein [Stellaceae bacterium]|nr:ABC transporter substrate-binding protein [Stellaceae bacterium]